MAETMTPETNALVVTAGRPSVAHFDTQRAHAKSLHKAGVITDKQHMRMRKAIADAEQAALAQQAEPAPPSVQPTVEAPPEPAQAMEGDELRRTLA